MVLAPRLGHLGDAVISAAENALLLTGDRNYMGLPRSQIDLMTAQGKLVGKTLHVPELHNDDGWFGAARCGPTGWRMSG